MKYIVFFIISSLPFISFSQINRPIGTNLAGVVDYSTELVFTDAFKQCREWTTYNHDGTGPWDTGAEVPKLSNGYPVEVPFDGGIGTAQTVRALMLWDLGEATPTGLYRLIVKGSGEISLHFGASGVFMTPVDTLVQVNGGVAISFERSYKNDPIHDIKFIYPEYVDNYESKTFNDKFIDFVKDFQNLRFMDWQRTNNSDVVTWNDRSPYNYYTQTLNSGVSYEYITELCNLTKKDPWICIPHLADDNYVIELAKFLKNNLDPSLKLHLEYSNEVWNGGFEQHNEAAQKALDAGYTGENWVRAWKWTAKRSADIFRIFEDEFGGSDRLYKIIPSQAVNSWLSNEIITYFKDPAYNPTQVSANALAIAPYFGGEVPQEIVSEGIVNSITVEQIIDRMEFSLVVSYDWMHNTKIVADNHNYELITYEGGQHLVGHSGNENIQELTDKLTAANRHPDLQDVYCQYFTYWYEHFGGLFANFSSHGNYSKWGSWGIKENMADTTNPKYVALKECVFAFNKETSAVKNISFSSGKIYPNPSADGIFTIEGTEDQSSVKIYDLNGLEIPYELIQKSTERIVLRIQRQGLFMCTIGDRSERRIYKLICH